MQNLIEIVERETPYFADNIMEPISDSLQKDINELSIAHHWNGCASVNIDEVIGTNHPDYAGKSWLNLLKNGRRMHINIPLLESNPGYYFETTPKAPAMYFIKVGEKIYIGSDGNHRTCIAKFFLHFSKVSTLSGVTIDEYVIDERFKSIYEKCLSVIRAKRLPIAYKILRKPKGRQDAPGLMADYFKLSLILTHITGASYELDISGMEEFIAESDKFLRRFTGTFKQLWR